MADEPITPARLAGAVDLSGLVRRAEQRASVPAADAGAPASGTPGPDAGAVGPGGGAPAGGPAGGPPPTDEAAMQARAEAAAEGREPIAQLPDAVIEGDEQTLQQFMQLSQFLPIIVEMHAAWSSDAQALSPVLARLVRAAQGRLVLVRIDLDAHPSLGQQPQVLGLLGGRPLQLFAGNPPQEQIEQLLAEVLQVAAQQGLRGYVQIEGAAEGEEPAEPAEPELPPLHREAYDAVDRGDYEAAVAAFDKAIAQNPADDDAKAGRAQVGLLQRLHGKTLDGIRASAADRPGDLDAQIDVADLDLSGGHVADAFDRLLTLFPTLDADGKTRVREHLLDLFLVVGNDDPVVAKARARLTNLLF